MVPKKKKSANDVGIPVSIQGEVHYAVENNKNPTGLIHRIKQRLGVVEKLELVEVLDWEGHEDIINMIEHKVSAALAAYHKQVEEEKMNKDGWKFICRLSPDGHKIFKPTPGTMSPPHGCRYAIADNSGVTPSDTHDGVLWVMENRPMRIRTDRCGVSVAIPVMLSNGIESSTPSDLKAARKLKELTKMPVECADADLHALLK